MHPRSARIIIEDLKDQGLRIEIEGPASDSKEKILPVTIKNQISLLIQEANTLIGKTDSQENSKERLKIMGQQLFECLGGTELRDFLSLSLSRLGEKEYLWLQFRIRSPEFEDCPLELLYDPILNQKGNDPEKDISAAEVPPFLALSPQI